MEDEEIKQYKAQKDEILLKSEEEKKNGRNRIQLKIKQQNIRSNSLIQNFERIDTLIEEWRSERLSKEGQTIVPQERIDIESKDGNLIEKVQKEFKQFLELAKKQIQYQFKEEDIKLMAQ